MADCEPQPDGVAVPPLHLGSTLHVIGAVQFFPKQLWLMKRLGHLTSEEIIQLGTAGDAEVQSLRKRTWMMASTA